MENAINIRRTRIKIVINSVFDCHLSPYTGDKWQSKTLFLSIYDLRSSIVLTFSIAAYPVCLGLHTINKIDVVIKLLEFRIFYFIIYKVMNYRKILNKYNAYLKRSCISQP